MAERALAHIEKIEWAKPIKGADNIELFGKTLIQKWMGNRALRTFRGNIS